MTDNRIATISTIEPDFGVDDGEFLSQNLWAATRVRETRCDETIIAVVTTDSGELAGSWWTIYSDGATTFCDAYRTEGEAVDAYDEVVAETCPTTDTTTARISNVYGDQNLARFGVPGDRLDDDYEEAREDLCQHIDRADRIRSTQWEDGDRGVTAEVAVVTHAGAWWVVWVDETSWIAEAWADRGHAEADYGRQARYAAGAECFGPADRSDIDELVAR